MTAPTPKAFPTKLTMRFSTLIFASLYFLAFEITPSISAKPEAASEELYNAAMAAKAARKGSEAISLLRQASELGHLDAMFHLGRTLWFSSEQADKNEARAIFLKAAESGHEPSMLNLARMLSQGSGGPVDGPSAIAWATRANEKDETGAASLLLGSIHLDGLGVPRDLDLALQWFERSAEAGNATGVGAAENLRSAMSSTPEEKFENFRKELAPKARDRDPSKSRGRAFGAYLRSLYTSGMSVDEAVEAAKPAFALLIETDFHGAVEGITAVSSEYRSALERLLTSEQRKVAASVRSYRSRPADRPAPEIAAGQGWSTVFPTAADRAEISTPTAAPVAAQVSPPTPTAAKPAATTAPKAPPPPQLTEFTREATNWETFFIGSAQRAPGNFHSRHEGDAKLFLKQHPATPEQLREAYRRAQDAFEPTPGSDLGKERGSMFVAYTVALEAGGMSTSNVVSFARAEFQELARSDLHNAYQALMGVKDPVAPWQATLGTSDQNRIKAINQTVLDRKPFPKVPDPWVEFAKNDPVGAAKELYNKLQADLAARDKGAPLLPEEEKALAELARLLPMANKTSRADFDRGLKEFIEGKPGASDFHAGNKAYQEKRFSEAVRLLEKAAAAGHPGAKLGLASYNFDEANTLPFERRKALLEEAYAADLPGAAYDLARLHFYREEPDLDEVILWSRASLEKGETWSGLLLYNALARQREAIEKDPLKTFEISDPQNRQAFQRELEEALGHLRQSALRGDIDSMYQLAHYHYAGGIPGLRAKFAFKRPDHNLHLARFWFRQVLESGTNLSEEALANVPRWIGNIEAALALAKGREWTADEVIEALDGGTSPNNLSWLLAREGGTFSKSEHTRILTSEGGKKIGDYSNLGMQLGFMVVTGPGKEAQELVKAAVAARRATAKPLPFPGDDMEALRRGYEAGDPAAAYALLRLLPSRHFGGWPADAPPRKQVIAVAISQDYAPAQYLRVDMDQLARSQDPTNLDLPRAFELLLASAMAGSAEAARNVADFYRGQLQTPVRPNLVEAEWWYAQAAALAWPKQFESAGGILEPERNLAHLYLLEKASIGGGISLDKRDPAAHRWLRELRRRGDVAKEIAEERIAYFGTSDAGTLDMEAFIAALPPAMPLMANDERAQLERDAAEGKTESMLKLARALAFGEGGFRQDDARAVALYQKAAESGSVEAMTALAEQLRGGFGAKRDYVTALAWQDRAEGKTRDRVEQLIEAARQAQYVPRANYLVEPYLREAIALGSVEAKQSLGSHMIFGRQVKKDVEQGMRLLKEAAEAGDVRAMTGLSFHYREGKEVPQDLEAAHRWRVRAAEAGDKNSIHSLVSDFDRGQNGAPIDARAALRWARLAEAEWIRKTIIGRERDVASLDRNPGMTTEELRKAKAQHQMQFYDTAMAATGETDYARAAALQGEARLAALREAARMGHVKATLDLIEDLARADQLHEAHWWTRRDWVLENEDAFSLRDSLKKRAGFNLTGLQKEGFLGGSVTQGFSSERDRPLEASLPELAEALANAGGNPRRLLGEVERVRDLHPDRAEAHIALAQLSMGQPDLARSLLEKAAELDPTHPQAQVLLARLDAAAGQPHRAYYRLLEIAEARPNSLQVATAQAELLHALGGSPQERTNNVFRVRRLLDAATPQEQFAGHVAVAKLAAGMNDLETAVVDLSAALAINRAPALLLERAQLHERLRNYPQALADYTAILAMPGALNPQQAAELKTRIDEAQKAMNAESARLQGDIEMMDEALARIDALNSEESKRERSSMMDQVFFFVAGNKAYQAGDLGKARENWTKAADAGHEEAAKRLRELPSDPGSPAGQLRAI